MGNFWTSLGTVSFSRRTLLLGVSNTKEKKSCVVRLDLHVAQTGKLELTQIILRSFYRPACLENDIKNKRSGLRILIHVARSKIQCLLNAVIRLGIL